MKTTFLTTQGCGAISRSGGFVPVAQQNRSTAGLQHQVIELPASLAVPSVLAGLLADATHCRRSTLTQPQSGTMRKTKACPATTLLALLTVPGGPMPGRSLGCRASTHAQMRCNRGLQGCTAFNKGKVLQADETSASVGAGLWLVQVISDVFSRSICTMCCKC